MKTVMLEYAWDMAWCDPCAADPVPAEDLRKMGVWWMEKPREVRPMPGQPQPRRMIAPMPPKGNARDAFVTRMHIRYTADTFPEDIMLQTTEDRQNFQGRYVMRHPWKNEATCEAAGKYYAGLKDRFEKEAKNLANLTGWKISDIRKKMEENGQSFDMKPTSDDRPWWEQMWNE